MSRIRTIKPGFFEHPDMAKLSYRARLTYVGSWCYVDDAGRGYLDLRLLKAAIWPQDDGVTLADIAEDFAALDELGRIERWTDATGRDCFRIRSFRAHQRINRPSAPKIEPSPEEMAVISAASRSTHGALTEGSPWEAEVEVEAEADGNVGGGGVDSDFEARVTIEARKRIATRRMKGDVITAKVETLIFDDVRQDLRALDRKATTSPIDNCTRCNRSGLLELDDGTFAQCDHREEAA